MCLHRSCRQMHGDGGNKQGIVTIHLPPDLPAKTTKEGEVAVSMSKVKSDLDQGMNQPHSINRKQNVGSRERLLNVIWVHNALKQSTKNENVSSRRS